MKTMTPHQKADRKWAATAKGKATLKAKKDRYRSTAKGKASQAWYSMNRRSGVFEGYKDVKVLMTRDEFLAWAIPEYEKALALDPNEVWSVDRINGGNYELGNIRIITRRLNGMLVKKNNRVHAPAGQSWCAGCVQYLPEEKFGLNRPTYNGLCAYCLECNGHKQRGSPKLTQTEADVIRAMYATGRWTYPTLAQYWGRKDPNTIWKVISGRTFPPVKS